VPKSRIIWGGTILVIRFMSPLLIPLVAYMPISEKWAVAISGLLLVGIPEVFMLIAVAIMGKPGYEYLKKYLLRLLRRYGPAEHSLQRWHGLSHRLLRPFPLWLLRPTECNCRAGRPPGPVSTILAASIFEAASGGGPHKVRAV
jgi:hypothetical protein